MDERGDLACSSIDRIRKATPSRSDNTAAPRPSLVVVLLVNASRESSRAT